MPLFSLSLFKFVQLHDWKKNLHKKGIIIVISLFFFRTFLQKKHSEFPFQHIFSPIYSD